MAERAIFLDRDNTIIANEGYLGDPAKVKLLPGAGAALAALHRLGYRIIVASNQSGVARGLFDEKAVEAVNQEMVRQLQQQAGAHVDASYYCPYHPEGTVPEYRIDHEWRKPRPGMLKAAAEDFNLDLTQSWMIGDMMRDIAAGAVVGCRTILLSDPEKPLPTDKGSPPVTPNFVVRTLADAARIIVREGNIPARDPSSAPLSTTPTAGVPTVAAGEVPKHVELSATQPSPPAAAPMAAPAIDSMLVASAVAEAVSSAVAAHLAKVPTPAASAPAPVPALESHKSLLEEMLQQLRQFNRRQDLHGFSLSLLFASTLQVLVLLFLSVAALLGFKALQITYKDPRWWFDKTTLQLFALAWLMAALVIQGIVLALYVRHRNK